MSVNSKKIDEHGFPPDKNSQRAQFFNRFSWSPAKPTNPLNYLFKYQVHNRLNSAEVRNPIKPIHGLSTHNNTKMSSNEILAQKIKQNGKDEKVKSC